MGKSRLLKSHGSLLRGLLCKPALQAKVRCTQSGAGNCYTQLAKMATLAALLEQLRRDDAVYEEELEPEVDDRDIEDDKELR